MAILKTNKNPIQLLNNSILTIILCILLTTSSILFVVPNANSGTGGPDGHGYRWINSSAPAPNITYNWINGVDGSFDSNLDTDNEITSWIPIGFKFPYYSSSYSNIAICSNGWASLRHNSYTSSSGTIPSSSNPDAVIAPFWIDLDPSVNGNITIKRNNLSAPMNLIITWNSVPFDQPPYQYEQTFEVVLYENGSILFQYKSINLTSGINPTIGIEDYNGNTGLSYLSSLIHNQSAIWFYKNYPAHDLSVQSITLDSWGKMNDNIKVDGWVENFGYKDETNVNISLRVNGIDVNWTGPTKNINAFSSIPISFDWYPSTQGNHTVGIYIHLSNDENLFNNIRTDTIDVRHWRGKVLYDRSNSGISYSQLQTFVDEIKKVNIIVEGVSIGSIDSNDLIGYDVYMSAYLYGWNLDSTEISTLQNYVISGHGVVIMSRYYYSEINTITSPFDIKWNELSSGRSGTYNNITKHEITTNVASVYCQYHRVNLVVEDAAKGLIYDDDKITQGLKLAISNESYPGRVACYVDPYGFEDNYINRANNKLLGTQIMDWVMGDSNPPKTPTGFKAQNGKVGNQVNLSWNANTERDLNGYYIYRGESPGVYDPQPLVVPGDRKSWVDKGDHLVDGTRYYYALAAVDEVPNISPLTSEKSAVPTDVIAPITPKNYSVRDVGTGFAINVSWNKNPEPDVQEYRVYKSEDFEFHDPQMIILSPEINFYVDTDVIEGKNYYYKVSAVDEVPNESPLTIVKDKIPYDRMPPEQPTGFKVTNPGLGNTIFLTWNHSQDEDLVDYVIERKDNKGNIRTFVVPAPTNHFNDTHNLDDGKVYYYRLFTRDDSKLKPPNNSPATPWQSGVSTDITPPATPTNFTLKDESYSTGIEHVHCLNLTWNISDDDDLRGFIIYKADYSGFTLKESRIIAIVGVVDHYKDFDVEEGVVGYVEYYYKITAFDEIPNESPSSIELKGLPKDISPPPTPTEFKAEPLPQGNAVKLSWALQPETETEGFRLFFRKNQSGNFTLLGEFDKSEDDYTHDNLNDDQIYYYKLQAYDIVPNFSPYTPILSVTPSDILPPSKPRGVRIDVVKTGRALRISWQPNDDDDIDGYRVYRSFEGGDYERIMAVDLNTTSIINTGLKDKMTYRYYITALDEVPNESDRSDIKLGMPHDNIPPNAPTGFSAVVSSDGSSVILTWTPIDESDIEYYHIYRSTDNIKFEKYAEVSYKNSTFIDKNVDPGTKYYYKISASDGEPNLSPKSNPIEIKVPEKESTALAGTMLMIGIGVIILIILLLLFFLVVRRKRRSKEKEETEKEKEPERLTKVPVTPPGAPSRPIVSPATFTSSASVPPGATTIQPQPGKVTMPLKPAMQTLPSKTVPILPSLPPAKTTSEPEPVTTAIPEPEPEPSPFELEAPKPEEPHLFEPAEKEPMVEEISPPTQKPIIMPAPMASAPQPEPTPISVTIVQPPTPKPTILIPLDDGYSEVEGVKHKKDHVTILNPLIYNVPRVPLRKPPEGIVVKPKSEKKRDKKSK